MGLWGAWLSRWRRPSQSAPASVGAVHYEKDIEAVIAREMPHVKARRERLARRIVEVSRIERAAAGGAISCRVLKADLAAAKAVVGLPLLDTPLLGLALSGGGIRSAAFCLGVMQAMDSVVQPDGAATDRAATDRNSANGAPADGAGPGAAIRGKASEDTRPSVFDRFDYLSTVSGGGYIGASLAAGMSLKDGTFPFRSMLDQQETAAVRHIRDHSNYLMPQRLEIVRASAIYLRGLALNIAFALPCLALLAVVLAGFRSGRDGLAKAATRATGDLGALARHVVAAPGFTVLAVLLVALFIWALVRSMFYRREVPPERAPRLAWIAAAIAAVLWLDASDVLLDLLIRMKSHNWDLAILTATLAPLSALVALVGPRLTAVVSKVESDPTWMDFLMRAMGVVLLWIGAAILPLLLWMTVLFITLTLVPTVHMVGDAACAVVSGAAGDPTSVCRQSEVPVAPSSTAWYVVGAIIGGGVLALCFAFVPWTALRWQIGAVSLHRLYRDSLSRAFLFRVVSENPPQTSPTDAFHLTMAATATDGNKIEGLKPDRAPYLLMNAAINLRGSPLANMRGRNADVFVFSHNYVGSRATGYVKTEHLLAYQPDMDVGTVMAASGAAFSSNMGANTIAPLTPTLALLNVRLGYWLVNPKKLPNLPADGSGRLEKDRWAFVDEMLGRLHEDRPTVYISDGGHIDNLGLMELLRRRCKLIVVVDAEEDRSYAFSSFMILQRHARLDMGVRIDVPWEAIRAEASAADGSKPGGCGPHVAIGRIYYAPPAEDGKGAAGRPVEEGVLVYIKSSLTDDENDIVRSYKRRWPRFPHETTLDQFFSEEQFEVYRALGFHAAQRFLIGLDRVAVARVAGDTRSRGQKSTVMRDVFDTHPLLETVRTLLRLPPKKR